MKKMVAGRTKAFFAASSFLKSSVCATRFQTVAFADGVRGSGVGGAGIFSPHPDGRAGRQGANFVPVLGSGVAVYLSATYITNVARERTTAVDDISEI